MATDSDSLSQKARDAINAGNLPSLRELLQGRSEGELRELSNAKTGSGGTWLIAASLRGHTGIVKYLVDLCFADVNLKGSAEFPSAPTVSVEDAAPLLYAAGSGHRDVVEYLIECSADVNTRAKNLSTPLHTACIRGHLEVVKCLVEHKAGLELAGISGHTALHQACSWGPAGNRKIPAGKWSSSHCAD